MVKVGPNFERVRRNFQPSLDQWKPIIERTTGLFMRMTTDQAEVVATVKLDIALPVPEDELAEV